MEILKYWFESVVDWEPTWDCGPYETKGSHKPQD